MKLLSIDFEFRERRDTKEYDVLCVAMSECTKTYSMWLKDNPNNIQKLKQFIETTDCTLIAHWSHAEIYSLLSLGINTDNINIIDTYVEARLNQNSDDKSKRKILSLADLCRKHNIFDYSKQYGRDDYKNDMRKLCIYNKEFTEQEQADILQYCEHDAINGYKLLQVLIKEHESIWQHKYNYDQAITRGNAVKGMVLGSFVGMPIDTDFLEKIRQNHSSIIEMHIKNSHELVQQCYERKGVGYTFKADKYAEAIDNLKLGHLWKRSEKTNKYSTKSDDLKELRYIHPFVESLYTTFRKIQSLKYLKYDVVKDYAKAFKAGELTLDSLTYPEIFSKRMVLIKKTFLATFVDYPLVGVSQDKVLEHAVDHNKDDLLRDLQLVEAYKMSQKEKEQLGEEDDEALDEDVSLYNTIKNGRVHIPYGTFGTITGRNTPKAKLFLMAQSAWQRSLIKVPKGYKLVAADFSGQEIYVGAMFHNDPTMLEAYFSKDFYCYVGAMMGVIPQEDFNTMTKGELGKKYGKERKLLKGLILGLGFLMGVQKLGNSLFSDLPASKATYKAKKMADKYRALLHRYFASGRKFVSDSKQPQWLRHWGHIGVERGTTANNFPIQGSAAEILHIAMADLSTVENWQRGLKVVCPLHDCLYALIKDDERFNDNLSLLTQGMKDATDEILGKDPHGRSIKIEYVIFEPDSNLIEKDRETAEQVAELVGHSLNFKYSEAKEV